MLRLKMIQRVHLTLIAFICIFLLVSCAGSKQQDVFTGPEVNPSATEDSGTIRPETPKPSPVPKTTTLELRAVGDIMMHDPQVEAGLQADGTYHFNHFFEDIQPYLKGADIVMGNLETTISNEEKGYSGYPNFRSPAALIEALKNAGFQILTTANNHALDGREFGTVHTLDTLDGYGLLHTGTARTSEERDRILMVEKNNIKVGILAYTYGTNGMEVTIPDGKLPFMINYIDRDRIREDIHRAREEGAEVLITCIHWGKEYERNPGDSQREMADFLASQGVDVIFGSHPHVLQPMERRKVRLEDGTEKEVFLIYSLGNFISNQRDPYRDSGVILDLKINKDTRTGSIHLGEISYTPTWVYRFSQNGKPDFRVLPVGKFMKNGELSGTAEERIRSVWNETTTHLGQDGFQVNE